MTSRPLIGDGLIPPGWNLKPLKHNLRRRSDKGNGAGKVIALENIEGWTGKELETGSTFDGDGVRFHQDDLLFGKLRPYLAKVFIARELGDAVGDLWVLRPEPNTDPRFMFYLLVNPTFIDIVNGSTNGAKMPRAEWSFVGSISVPTPPHEEQTAIARFLDRETARIDSLIEKKGRFIELLKEKRAAVITHAVTKGLDPNAPMKESGIGWLGFIPNDWQVVPLKQIGIAVIGLTYSPEQVVGEGEGTLVLRSSNIQGGKLSYEDNVFVSSNIPSRLRTRKSDLLICSRNGSRDLIGKCALIDDGAVGHSFGAFTTVFRSEMNEFVYYIMNSDLFRYQAGMFMTSTINQLTTGMLYNFKVPLPPTATQQQILSYLETATSRIDTLIAKTERSIELLREKRSALITAAVTGKIDVRAAA